MAMRSKVFTYQAELQWQGGRTATVASGDRPELTIAPPPDFPAGESGRWSPEHLFLAALQSCTMLSFLAHCEHNDLEVTEYSASASGSIERRGEDHRYAFTHVAVVVQRAHGRRPGRGRARADRKGRARLLHHGLDDRAHRDRLADHRMTAGARPAAATSTLADTRAAAEEAAERRARRARRRSRRRGVPVPLARARRRRRAGRGCGGRHPAAGCARGGDRRGGDRDGPRARGRAGSEPARHQPARRAGPRPPPERARHRRRPRGRDADRPRALAGRADAAHGRPVLVPRRRLPGRA